MPKETLTLGQAIDQIAAALSKIDPATRNVALSAVCAMLNIDFDAKTGAPPKDDEKSDRKFSNVEKSAATRDIALAPRTVKDIRTLKEEKKPTSAQQMACLVAYYLSELAPDEDHSDTVSSADLDKYFKQANFKLPEDIKQVLKNAKRAGYFDSAERGKYKLNAVGFNLVTHGLTNRPE